MSTGSTPPRQRPGIIFDAPVPAGPGPQERVLPSRRNGLPEPRPYIRRPGEAEREEWVRARLEAVRAQLARREEVG